MIEFLSSTHLTAFLAGALAVTVFVLILEWWMRQS